MHGSSKDQSWINVRPGVAVEIEYDRVDYQMAIQDDEVPAKLTGRVRISQKEIFAADFLTDAVTGRGVD